MERVGDKILEFNKNVSVALHNLKKIGKKKIIDRANKINDAVTKVKEKVGDNKLGIGFGKNGTKI